MTTSTVGFVALYRWQLRAGMEDSFQQAWSTVTMKLREERKALGSRLHQAQDGSWIAYAQWPNKQAWEDSRRMKSVDSAASAIMAAAIEESFPPILLDPVLDHLICC